MIICVVGPTGVGKTKLSVELAKIYNGEIINADSMQIYKGLDIGTAKITEKEKEGIIHHLFDIRTVFQDYSSFDYQTDARRKIKEIKSRGKVPIFVGGTGYYLKAALYDYDFKEESHRGNLNDDNEKKELRLLYDDVIIIGLTTDRKVLYERIDKRLDDMIVDLVDEVKPFYLQNVRTKALMNGIGYKELYSFFDNEKTLKECAQEIKKNSRNYAKRQYTWFENQMDVNWFSTNYDDFSKTVLEVSTFIDKN